VVFVKTEGAAVDRRGFLRTAGGFAVLGGATVLLPGAAEASTDSDAERRRLPVFSWERFGGFVGPGIDPLTAPRLVAYGDRTVVADAARTFRLAPGELWRLQWHAAEVLSDPANLRRRPGAPIIADAPSTRFEAADPRRSRHRYSGTVEALEEYRDQHAYPSPLYGLLDDAAALRQRTLDAGRPFTPAAVRLVVVVFDQVNGDPNGPVLDWPAGVPVPRVTEPSRIGRLDLHGPTARRVVRGIDSRRDGIWQTFRTGNGVLLQAAWRYLLPHE
jgi:hypothetical protein